MAIAVEVPKLGNTVEECLISKWRKRKGEHVSAGEVVVDIETDKATFEVPAPADGTVLATFLEEGVLVPVFTNLFVLGEPGENTDSFRPQGAAPPVAAAVEIVEVDIYQPRLVAVVRVQHHHASLLAAAVCQVDTTHR